MTTVPLGFLLIGYLKNYKNLPLVSGLDILQKRQVNLHFIDSSG